MTDYVKSQSFTALRGSTPADPAVFDTEFLTAAAASATKVDKTGSTMTGYLSVPSGATGTQAPQYQEVSALINTRIAASPIPVGTKMAFFQASAPTGWTQDITNNDALFRIVNGAGGGTGGTNSPTLASTLTGGHVLTIAEMPAHTHTGFVGSVASPLTGAPPNAPIINVSGSTGSTGGNAAHTHTIAYAPKYIDMIVCSKN